VAVAGPAAAAPAAGIAAPGADPLRSAGTRVLAFVALLAAAAAQARPGPEVHITASAGGFEPAEVTLRRGQVVQVVLTAEDREHCFALDAFRVEKRIVTGRETSFDFTPDREGRFLFYCCVEEGEAATIERGLLIVTE
jgi:heme/copper-type cytochrome/quinol oxidase subunit 2